jgi:hypothetical protein
VSVYTPEYGPFYDEPSVVVNAGFPVTLELNFYSPSAGELADPASVQLDITYGNTVGFVPDVAGPFYYSGAGSPTAGQVWKTAVGQYSCTWLVPSGTTTGVYTANWSGLDGGNGWLAVENFGVEGAMFTAPTPAGDTGYWTGSVSYAPPASNLAQLTPVYIPLGAVDQHGICWLLQKVTGWDGPDVQGGGVIPKSGDHGAYAAPQYYAARNITLTVTASAPTQALRDVARGLLQEAIPISDLAVFQYNEPVPKQALVRRSGTITEAYPTLCDVTFTIGLVAPDPRKYGTQPVIAQANAATSSGIGFAFPIAFPFAAPPQPPSGAVIVTNAGTFETRPVITVQGPVTSPSLTNVTTGQTVSWTGLVLGPTDVLSADFSLAQGTLNGAYRPADVFSSWWTLPPQVPCTVALGGEAGSGAGIEVQFSPAWI